ncbi:MAG TPA: PCMD domain-containing protein, partial [Draconibacterium sp.]|nr:PCMD domain-containing protein [Draconibacterium sp.]
KQPGNLFGGFTVTNIEGKDKFGVEIALEKRVGENMQVVAKTNFQSDQDKDQFTEIVLPVNYLSSETPTHFYISFSPSFDGGTFKGAVGSALIIDDLEIIYD